MLGREKQQGNDPDSTVGARVATHWHQEDLIGRLRRQQVLGGEQDR